MQKFSVIIPLIPLHDSELKRIFRLLFHEQHLIEELIVCRSETPKNKIRKIERKYRNYAQKANLRIPVHINSIEAKAWDGTNRNRGIKVARGHYLAFMDADDNYVENRLSILAEILKDTSVCGVLHSYADENLSQRVVLSEFLTKPLEYTGKNSTDLETPLKLEGKDVKIHHAHLTIRNSEDTDLFTSIFPGADTEYCKRLVMQKRNIQYCPESLSSWNRKRNFRYKTRLLKRKFGLNS